MLSTLLKQGIETILMIVSITQEEINQIKQAHSKLLFANTAKKNNLINTFYTKKIEIDNQISKIKNNNFNQDMKECLSEEEINLFDELEKNLLELKNINKTYKRIVLGVGEFYLSMLEKLLPNQMKGYDNVTSLQNTFNINI
jgi:hypothetical protein